MYKEDLALDNLQRLICHEAKLDKLRREYISVFPSDFFFHFYFSLHLLSRSTTRGHAGSVPLYNLSRLRT